MELEKRRELVRADSCEVSPRGERKEVVFAREDWMVFSWGEGRREEEGDGIWMRPRDCCGEGGEGF